jgi:leucyl aminopeptidase
MQFKLTTQPLIDIKTDCLILPIVANKPLTPQIKAVNQALEGLIAQIIDSGEVNQFKQTVFLPAITGIKAKSLLLVALGETDKLSYADFCQLLKTIYQRLANTTCKNSYFNVEKLSVTGHDHAWSLHQAVCYLHELDYKFDNYKSKKQNNTLQQWGFQVAKNQLTSMKKSLDAALALTNGIKFTKDLGNTPCNIAVPSYLGKQAEQLAKDYNSINVKIHDEKALKKLKMGGILAVGAGSQHESRLIEIHYKGSRKKQDPIVLVGKGVTFDTGGVSLKPGPGMEEMKYDMCGAATLFGVMKAIAELQLPINVSAIIPSAENMPDGVSYKPGDVITSYSGQTIEILNTDAEGRLLLCDGLTHAKQFKPKILIDVATLTGAMVMSLGTTFTGYFTADEKLAKQVDSAALNSEDKAWRMPLDPNFVRETDSKVADMRNIGSRWGGACIAAGFLSRFVEPTQCWMHMDIAGVAYTMGNSVGATGRPVALLVELLKTIQ